MTDYIEAKGKVKKLYLPNAFQLENGKMYSEYGGLTTDVKVGDTIDFKYSERAKDGKIYNNVLSGSLKVTLSGSENLGQRGSVDWDAIAEGKIRSLFIQAHITRKGIIPLTEMEKDVLKQLVAEAMGERKQ